MHYASMRSLSVFVVFQRNLAEWFHQVFFRAVKSSNMFRDFFFNQRAQIQMKVMKCFVLNRKDQDSSGLATLKDLSPSVIIDLHVG